MNPGTYNRIGSDYNDHRAAEPSVVSELVALLDLDRGAVVADIGAGTGNYPNALARLGYIVQAVEPSSLMREQAIPTAGVKWHEGTAEALPLADNSVQGVVCTLALHHFASIERAAVEIRRVCPRGPVVILTIDPRLGESFWFSDYFPAIYERLFSTFPLVEAVCQRLAPSRDSKWVVVRYLLPANSVDITMHSGWNKPEVYLDKSHRQNMSGFALAPPSEVEPGLVALREAIDSGSWERTYGHLRKWPTMDLGFRFIRLERMTGREDR